MVEIKDEPVEESFLSTRQMEVVGGLLDTLRSSFTLARGNLKNGMLRKYFNGGVRPKTCRGTETQNTVKKAEGGSGDERI